MTNNELFCKKSFGLKEKALILHCVFHSIRFKVNKGWVTAVTLFFCVFCKKCLLFRKKVVNLLSN